MPPTPLGQSETDEHETGEGDERRAEAEARLARAGRAEARGQPGCRPPLVPDRRALERDPEEPEPAARDQESGVARIAGRAPPGEEREGQREERREQPPAPVAKALEESGRGLGVPVPAKPAGLGDAFGEPVPRKENQAQPGEREPGGRLRPPATPHP